MTAGVAVCVAGPAYCSEGYRAMQELTAKLRAIKTKRTRERRRKFAGYRSRIR